MSVVERTATLASSPAEVWAVLADFGAISAWVPLVQHSCLLSEQTEGVGAVRRVQIAFQTFVERVVAWDPPSRLAYTIEGLPPVVGTAINTWRIIPTTAGCDAVLTTEIETGANPIRRLAAKKALERLAIASDVMLAGLAAVTTTGARA